MRLWESEAVRYMKFFMTNYFRLIKLKWQHYSEASNMKTLRKSYLIMTSTLSLFLLLLNSSCMVSTLSMVYLTPDGGYKGIVVRIDKDVNQDHCQEIIKNLKSMFTAGSPILHSALSGRAYFSRISIVVPFSWSEEKCNHSITTPTGNTPYKSTDLLISPGAGLAGSIPYTVQSKQCGEQGEKIIFSEHFFTAWNTTIARWGQPAKLLVKEWAKYRYGVFDEFGFSGDRFYPNYFKSDGRIYPTGTTNAMLTGSWIYKNGSSLCDPTADQCYFKPEGPNKQITCSLNYVPFLDTVTEWCDKDQGKSEIGQAQCSVSRKICA